MLATASRKSKGSAQALTMQQSAERCGLAYDTFRQHVHRYKIPHIKYNARCIRFDPAVIDAHKEKFSVGGESRGGRRSVRTR